MSPTQKLHTSRLAKVVQKDNYNSHHRVHSASLLTCWPKPTLNFLSINLIVVNTKEEKRELSYDIKLLN